MATVESYRVMDDLIQLHLQDLRQSKKDQSELVRFGIHLTKLQRYSSAMLQPEEDFLYSQ
ncbi:unnamed protein product [Brassica oleracea]